MSDFATGTETPPPATVSDAHPRFAGALAHGGGRLAHVREQTA
ncbi:hypothetical protein ACFC0M_21320 [Streptomyces sp. NPDC056149]|nr:hypothetical protein [Streptomyces sp. WZ-12]